MANISMKKSANPFDRTCLEALLNQRFFYVLCTIDFGAGCIYPNPKLWSKIENQTHSGSRLFQSPYGLNITCIVSAYWRSFLVFRAEEQSIVETDVCHLNAMESGGQGGLGGG
jgi:hypothetical protein